MHSQSKEIIDKYKMTVGDMTLEAYKIPPFILAEIIKEFMVEATIRKNRRYTYTGLEKMKDVLSRNPKPLKWNPKTKTLRGGS